MHARRRRSDTAYEHTAIRYTTLHLDAARGTYHHQRSARPTGIEPATIEVYNSTLYLLSYGHMRADAPSSVADDQRRRARYSSYSAATATGASARMYGLLARGGGASAAPFGSAIQTVIARPASSFSTRHHARCHDTP